MFGSLHLDALESQPFTWSGTCCNFDLIVDDRSTTALVRYIMFSVMSIRHLSDERNLRRLVILGSLTQHIGM